MSSPRRPALGSTLYDLAVETFAVLLGVTIALGAGQWQAGREADARGARARARIVEEVRANRDSVRAARDYHAGLVSALRPHMAPGDPGPGLRAFPRGFIHPAQPLTTAWDAATATDALAAMDYGEVLAFSHLYAEQRRYEESAREGGRVIYGRLLEEGTAGIAANFRNLLSLIFAQRYLEESLLQEYDRVLAAVGEGADGAAPSP